MLTHFGMRKLLIALSITLFTLAIPLFWRGTPPQSTPTSVPLLAPPFLQVAHAQSPDSTGAITANIADEAGISAYFQAPSAINLAQVRGQFRVIEDETADYIVGSVPVKDYPETQDVHVYVHKDGWILAYYLKADPSGKIFDWVNYEKNANVGTKFEIVIANVLAAAGLSFTQANYYDFRYPNASHMMIVVENGNYETFQLKLPSNFNYFERSAFTNDDLAVNNTWILEGHYCCSNHFYTTIQATQLPLDQFHTINVHGTGGLMLIYKEQ